jgi:hypothetical protein
MRDFKLMQIKHRQESGTGSAKPETRRTPIVPIDIPSHFYKLADAEDDDEVANKAKSFIEARKLKWQDYPYYLSTGITKRGTPADEAVHAKRLRERLIIPAFKGEKMIHYQGRYMDPIPEGKKIEKYVNPLHTPRTNIIYGMDRLFEYPKRPLFVTEGFFDAQFVMGVAVLTNKLSAQQAEILSRSPRRKVVIPDRKGDSKRLAEDAIREGYGVSVPNWGDDVKDVNDAVKKYGRLYVVKSLMEAIKFGTAAKIVVSRMK